MENTIVYKIFTIDEYNNFEQTKIFSGTNLDLKDGYIHMSKNMDQVNRVIDKYYKNIPIVLAELNLNSMKNVKFEQISNGDTYPHLYDILKFSYLIKSTIIQQ